MAALIETIAGRASTDTDRLASSMLSHCWPGGVGDRSDSAALAWVSRWRPRKLETPRFRCGCRTGYCAVCN